MEHEARSILVNAAVVVGVFALGMMAFYGVLKFFSVLADIPLP